MTIAQCKAARRKFRQYYRKDNPIGTPHYKRRSTLAMDRREQRVREKMRTMMGRGFKK